MSKKDIIKVAFMRTKPGETNSECWFGWFDGNMDQNIDYKTSSQILLNRLILEENPNINQVIEFVLRSGVFFPWKKHYILEHNQVGTTDEGEPLTETTLKAVSKEVYDDIYKTVVNDRDMFQKSEGVSPKKAGKVIKTTWSKDATEVIYDPAKPKK